MSENSTALMENNEDVAPEEKQQQQQVAASDGTITESPENESETETENQEQQQHDATAMESPDEKQDAEVHSQEETTVQVESSTAEDTKEEEHNIEDSPDISQNEERKQDDEDDSLTTAQHVESDEKTNDVTVSEETEQHDEEANATNASEKEHDSEQVSSPPEDTAQDITTVKQESSTKVEEETTTSDAQNDELIGKLDEQNQEEIDASKDVSIDSKSPEPSESVQQEDTLPEDNQREITEATDPQSHTEEMDAASTSEKPADQVDDWDLPAEEEETSVDQKTEDAVAEDTTKELVAPVEPLGDTEPDSSSIQKEESSAPVDSTNDTSQPDVVDPETDESSLKNKESSNEQVDDWDIPETDEVSGKKNDETLPQQTSAEEKPDEQNESLTNEEQQNTSESETHQDDTTSNEPLGKVNSKESIEGDRTDLDEETELDTNEKNEEEPHRSEDADDTNDIVSSSSNDPIKSEPASSPDDNALTTADSPDVTQEEADLKMDASEDNSQNQDQQEPPLSTEESVQLSQSSPNDIQKDYSDLLEDSNKKQEESATFQNEKTENGAPLSDESDNKEELLSAGAEHAALEEENEQVTSSKTNPNDSPKEEKLSHIDSMSPTTEEQLSRTEPATNSHRMSPEIQAKEETSSNPSSPTDQEQDPSTLSTDADVHNIESPSLDSNKLQKEQEIIADAPTQSPVSQSEREKENPFEISPNNPVSQTVVPNLSQQDQLPDASLHQLHSKSSLKERAFSPRNGTTTITNGHPSDQFVHTNTANIHSSSTAHSQLNPIQRPSSHEQRTQRANEIKTDSQERRRGLRTADTVKQSRKVRFETYHGLSTSPLPSLSNSIRKFPNHLSTESPTTASPVVEPLNEEETEWIPADEGDTEEPLPPIAKTKKYNSLSHENRLKLLQKKRVELKRMQQRKKRVLSKAQQSLDQLEMEQKALEIQEQEEREKMRQIQIQQVQRRNSPVTSIGSPLTLEGNEYLNENTFICLISYAGQKVKTTFTDVFGVADLKQQILSAVGAPSSSKKMRFNIQYWDPDFEDYAQLYTLENIPHKLRIKIKPKKIRRNTDGSRAISPVRRQRSSSKTSNHMLRETTAQRIRRRETQSRKERVRHLITRASSPILRSRSPTKRQPTDFQSSPYYQVNMNGGIVAGRKTQERSRKRSPSKRSRRKRTTAS